jgi:prepilin-type N-terminal cleavage/methylation domain-containing protein
MYVAGKNATLRRHGFTLVELLVVIAIIAILAAMASWAIVAVVGGQERRNTESTIKVVNKILQTHWNAVIAEADADANSGTISPAVLAMAGGDPARAKVLWRKFRLMEAFPETYAEIGTAANPPWVYWDPVNNVSYIPSGQQRYIADYQKKLLVNGVAVTKAINPLTESGACLRLALSEVRGGATVLNDDKIKYAIADTDGDGIPELIDSFENPKQALAFFRFAWNYTSTNNMVSMQGVKGWQNLNPGFGKTSRVAQFPDPQDPDGTLVNPGWVNNGAVPNPYRTLFEMYFHPVTNPYPLPANAKPPYTGCYVAPMIVSAGPGFDAPSKSRPFGFTVNAQGYFAGATMSAMQPDMSVALPNFEKDNIYSYQLTGN